MQITFTIPDNIATDVVNNICAATHYQPASGTKAAWARRQIIDHVKRMNKQGASMLAGKAAADTATSEEMANPIT